MTVEFSIMFNVSGLAIGYNLSKIEANLSTMFTLSCTSPSSSSLKYPSRGSDTHDSTCPSYESCLLDLIISSNKTYIFFYSSCFLFGIFKHFVEIFWEFVNEIFFFLFFCHKNNINVEIQNIWRLIGRLGCSK